MNDISGVDAGTGYGHRRPSYDARLTEVGPGTPMGEAMRRYWHPIASSAALTPDLPHRTRILGEDLVVFRDKQGRAGVVFERCAHRGTSLYYGRIEDDGIRCCYHGWKFDVQGRCLEQPCEPARRRHNSPVRQPWYPVEERYGLVFVYMGPPERKPALPRYEILENLEEGEQYYATIPVPGCEVTGLVNDYNWLQIFENAIDPVHGAWLHFAHSGPQFGGTGSTGFPENFFDPYTVAERVTYEKTEFGACYNYRYLGQAKEGAEQECVMITELHLPNLIVLPDFVEVTPDAPPDVTMIWIVPADDTSHRMFISVRSRDPMRVSNIVLNIKQNGKNPWELSEEEVQRFPGDGEAQRSQGPITLHSEEHLVSSDHGVVLLRRMLGAVVDDVAAGRNPQGVCSSEESLRPVKTGVFTQKCLTGAE